MSPVASGCRGGTMSYGDYATLAVVIVMLIYLIVALVRPERF